MSIRSKSDTKSRLALLMVFILCAVGCDDPIYQRSDFSPVATKIVLDVDGVEQRYEWPLSSMRYLVAKPPPMAFVTSFGGPLQVPDRVNAEVVPWREDDFHPIANELLHHLYAPIQKKLKVHNTIATDVLLGPLGFDVSLDGKRMVTLERKAGVKQLGLYDMVSGKLLGHMKLPSVVGQQDVQAVRFCGKSADFLLASHQKVFRISSKDGSVLSSGKGPNEDLEKWVVAENGEAMAMLTSNGRVLGGDTMLEFFTLYNFGKDKRVPDIAIKPDGGSLVTFVDGKLRSYRLANHQLAGSRDLEAPDFGSTSVAVATGASTDAWVDGRRLAFRYDDGEYFENGSNEMFWRTQWLSACTADEKSNWFLSIGERLKDGKEELVLFSYGPSSRNHSLPILLDEMPKSIRHSQNGERLAVLDSAGLQICQRPSWQTNRPQMVSGYIEQLLEADALDQVDKLCDTIRAQKRYGSGALPSELVTSIVTFFAERWNYLESKEPGSPQLAKLKNWHATKSIIAHNVVALRHHRLSWEIRGPDGVSASIADKYANQQDLALKELEFALDVEKPTLLSLSTRIQLGLESDEGIADVDKFCRQSALISPDDASLYADIAFKLMPQWYGEAGDCVSFILSAARTLQGGDADFLYARIMGGTYRHLVYLRSYPVHWGSYDTNRMKRGLAECYRREAYPEHWFWGIQYLLREWARDQVTADRMIEHVLEFQAAPPKNYSNSNSFYQQRYGQIKATVARLRK